MRGWLLAQLGVIVLVGACIFEWDAYDPRLAAGGGAGGEAGASGGAGGVAVGGGGGTSGCPSGSAECDGNRDNGCEDLSSDARCGACDVACAPTTRCGTMLTQSFGAPPSDWQLNGVAHHDATSASLVLTDALTSDHGTAFYVNTIATDSFTASFEAQISDSPNGTGGGAPTSPGDGMAFALQTSGADALGANGGGLGVAGLVGFGFELDTYDNSSDMCGDPGFEHTAIIDLTACGADIGPTTLQASAALAMPLPETGWHLVEVEFDAGVATMRLDGTVVGGPTAVPNFAASTPYFYGFGAGTGGAVNRHEVRNLTIAFPTPRCM